MKVLVLGGTGAMGVHLVQLLAQNGVDVTVTSRSSRESEGRVCYLKGNAHDSEFLMSALKENWDAIVDFMNYSTATFQSNIKHLINASPHYVYLSSARVYADSRDPISEDSPRLLDASQDTDYLASNEYSLEKARQENHLFSLEQRNWTIIRPYITYASQRLQLEIFEKEKWLYRALHGRSIVVSSDLQAKMTTLTHGLDVSRAILAILGDPQAMGEVYNTTCSKALAWSDVLEVYLKVLESHLGYRPSVKHLGCKSYQPLSRSKYMLLYDRSFDRSFDNKKIAQHIPVDSFTNVDAGIQECMRTFLENPAFKNIDWKAEAQMDRVAAERTPLREIAGLKQKMRYLRHRYLHKLPAE